MKIPTLTEQILIEEVLANAENYGLKIEVRDFAEKTWDERKGEEDFTLLDAYHISFNDWVK